MCLNIVFRDKEEKKVLAKLPEMVTCWKVVNRRGNQHGSKYAPEYQYQSGTFLAGWNNTSPVSGIFNYQIAFHAFLTKETADRWRNRYESMHMSMHIVKCKTEKKDIVAIGKQMNNLCIVTKRIWIPKPKKKPA